MAFAKECFGDMMAGKMRWRRPWEDPRVIARITADTSDGSTDRWIYLKWDLSKDEDRDVEVIRIYAFDPLGKTDWYDTETSKRMRIGTTYEQVAYELFQGGWGSQAWGLQFKEDGEFPVTE